VVEREKATPRIWNSLARQHFNCLGAYIKTLAYA